MIVHRVTGVGRSEKPGGESIWHRSIFTDLISAGRDQEIEREDERLGKLGTDQHVKVQQVPM